MEYSLVEMFGELPVDPDIFSTLAPRLKWSGKASEGGVWCVECGTLEPKVPNKHHLKCSSYVDADKYPEYKNPLGNCPECKSDDLYLDSCREMRCSVISCGDCGYQYSGDVDEETLTEQFIGLLK